MRKKRDQFDSIAPIDYRYWDEEVAQYFSETGFLRYKLLVERALIRTLCRHGVCSKSVAKEIERACTRVAPQEVYTEEGRIKHDIRALVNVIRSKVSDAAKPYVHLTATSYDIIDSANALRFKEVLQHVLVPKLIALEKTLIKVVRKEAETVQVGRTHGQHAVPVTFGFALAGYVSRLGKSIEELQTRAHTLAGKFSGAVGAYNASTLLFKNPETFERDVLTELGLAPAEHSTQIAPPEPLVRLLCEVAVVMGIVANLADDMRHLQRTEIGEVGELFEPDQVGSSTMPHKRNPIHFENAKSMWKIVMPRLITVFMDQISEHQRDLTNSASARTYGEMIGYTVVTIKRVEGAMKQLVVDRSNLKRNFALQKGMTAAEPLYIILASLGHPDAHEKVRLLTLEAERTHQPLEEVIRHDSDMKNYLKRMTLQQRAMLTTPELYTGIAAKKAKAIADTWGKKLKL